MGSSGKGPATVRYNMISSEETAYNIALGSGNLWIACLKLAGIAGLLPKKYEIEIPQIPKETRKQTLELTDRQKVLEWIEATQQQVYQGIQKFIEEEYKKGNLDSF